MIVMAWLVSAIHVFGDSPLDIHVFGDSPLETWMSGARLHEAGHDEAARGILRRRSFYPIDCESAELETNRRDQC
jgi:hypothetical protein